MDTKQQNNNLNNLIVQQQGKIPPNTVQIKSVQYLTAEQMQIETEETESLIAHMENLKNGTTDNSLAHDGLKYLGIPRIQNQQIIEDNTAYIKQEAEIYMQQMKEKVNEYQQRIKQNKKDLEALQKMLKDFI